MDFVSYKINYSKSLNRVGKWSVDENFLVYRMNFKWIHLISKKDLLSKDLSFWIKYLNGFIWFINEKQFRKLYFEIKWQHIRKAS